MLSDAGIIGVSEITLPIEMLPNSTDSDSNLSCYFPFSSGNTTHFRIVLLSASFSWILILNFKSEIKLVFPILSVEEVAEIRKLNLCVSKLHFLPTFFFHDCLTFNFFVGSFWRDFSEAWGSAAFLFLTMKLFCTNISEDIFLLPIWSS